MHRTQILLEQWQYDALRARAEREGRSMSDLIREILHKALNPDKDKRRLTDIEGIGEDTQTTGRKHDQTLYRNKARK